ncbi:MAG: tail fiber domain-containing protein [Chloroflexi bacterium]|nr:tail fiber domain-containing protein [Chloroflexota bacterium]
MSYQLAGAVAIHDQTVNLTASFTLPGGSYPCRIRVDSETMIVTGGAGSGFLSVQRGVDGTAPAAHDAGATVYDDTDTDEHVGDLVADTLTADHATGERSPNAALGVFSVGGFMSRGIGGRQSGFQAYQTGPEDPIYYVYHDRAGDSTLQVGDVLFYLLSEGSTAADPFYAFGSSIGVSVGAIDGDGIEANLDVALGTLDGTSPSRLQVRGLDGTVRPGADNAQKLGDASRRWSVVYAGTGTINTSDRGAKQDVRTVAADDDGRALLGVARRLSDRMSSYRMKDAVEQKGDDARIHHGVTAQDVEAAFKAEGLDPARYGVWCRDAWDERVEVERVPLPHERGVPPSYERVETVIPAGEALGIRYEELFALMFAGMNARLAALEERLGL